MVYSEMLCYADEWKSSICDKDKNAQKENPIQPDRITTSTVRNRNLLSFGPCNFACKYKSLDCFVIDKTKSSPKTLAYVISNFVA